MVILQLGLYEWFHYTCGNITLLENSHHFIFSGAANDPTSTALLKAATNHATPFRSACFPCDQHRLPTIPLYSQLTRSSTSIASTNKVVVQDVDSECSASQLVFLHWVYSSDPLSVFSRCKSYVDISYACTGITYIHPSPFQRLCRALL